jgi:opacity protein-like surface antigen
MARRPRLLVACVALAAALTAAGAAVSAPAHAYVTTDLTDFNLTETTSSYNNGTQFHISSVGDGSVSYRWLDYPDKSTVISGNACTDYSNLGSRTISIGSTSYHTLFWGFTYQCFVVRGRTTSGSGSLVNHDGRIQR